MSFYLGIDFGTSGARAIAIDANEQIQVQVHLSVEASTPKGLATSWKTTLFDLIQRIPINVLQQVRAIAINGTSSTVLLCDNAGTPLDEPILYNDSRGATMVEAIRAIAPPNHTVISATSSLAKLLWWGDTSSRNTISLFSTKTYLLHQADWLGFLLHGQLGISDYHNALKLGYDVAELRYPDWVKQAAGEIVLPRVLVPGEAIAPIAANVAARFGFPKDCVVCAGTTDSIAAFLASGAQSPGQAVTSLGSTLVLKLLSTIRVDDARYGIYSHRMGDWWLVGGASNTGGAVLKQFFTSVELEQLSQQISPNQESPLKYYPLLKPGERFPINDPNLEPQLEPQPNNRVEFLHGLLESVARIEARGYELLQALGATSLTHVYTAGGGAKNKTWMEIRSRHLKVPVAQSAQAEAAYGSALLAKRGAT